MRKLIFSIVALLALLLLLETGLTIFSQKGMEKALKAQYDLPDNLKVNINSFPFIISLIRNHLGELELSWDDELGYRIEAGAIGNISYSALISIYDVELNMPSLLSGRLDIRAISRIKAQILFDEGSINRALEPWDAVIEIDDGVIFITMGSKKSKYIVKAVGGDGVIFVPVSASTSGAGSDDNPNFAVDTASLQFEFPDLPLGVELQSATSKGDKVIVEVLVPEWEGYM